MRKFLPLLFLAMTSLLSMEVVAQSRTVTGTVTSGEDGTTIPGANVIVKGTTNGAVTDFDGNYSLVVDEQNTTLVFSYVGFMSKEVQVGSRSVVNVELQLDVTQLNEVVITAYGETSKKDFTGSASTISAEDIALRPVTNPLAGIEGNATGVQFINSSGAPGSSPGIVIRGVGSLNGNISPLIIVDGVQFNGSLVNINQDDIASMTVLKDAASTSLYGSRAAGGVIIITTKGGRKGQPIKVQASSQIGAMSPAIQQYEATSPAEYYEVMWQSYKNSLIADGNSEADAINLASSNIYNRLGYNPFNVANDDIVRPDGRINPDAEVVYPSLNWFDELQRTGVRQNHSVSVSGGSENTSLFFSTGYLDEKGYVIESDFKRLSTRLKADINANDWLTLGGNAYMSLTERGGVGGAGSGSIVNPFGFAKNMGAIYPVFIVDPATNEIVRDAAGNPLYDRGEGYPQYGIPSRPQSQGRHAIEEAILNDISDNENAFGLRTYAELSVPWVEGLKVRLNYARDYQEAIIKDYENAKVGDGQPTARYSENRFRRQVINANQLITYQNTLLDYHNLDLTLGHESYERTTTGANTFIIQQVAEGIYENDNFSVPTSIGGSTSVYALESYFARFNYNYNNRYYLTLSGRRDGSSVFDPDVRWGNFFAVGASWRLSDESFMSGVTFIDDLKLRTSYGEVGQDNLGDNFISQARYSLTSNAGNPAITLSDLGNAALTWETIINFDVAAEFSLFDYLIDGSVEYYRRGSQDLLYNVPIPVSNGLNAIPDNIADMVNYGMEVSLTGHILRNPDGLSWDLTAMATTLNNEITSIPDPVQNGTKRWSEGRSRFDFYIWHSAGVDPQTGDQLYYVFEDDPETGFGVPVLDADGNQETTNDWTDAGRAYTGDSSIPNVIGSVTNRLSWKGLDLNILMAFSQGGKVLDFGYAAMMSSGDYGESHHVDQLQAWKAPGDVTTVPRLENGNSLQVQTSSTRFLTDMSWISLRNVNLTYNFPRSLLENVQLSSLNVFVSGENLWFNTARQGLNPQYNLAGTGSGNDYNPNRIFSVGLNVGF